MEHIQDFMLLFHMQPTNQELTAEQITAMQKHWGIFIGGIAAQAKLVSTSRFGYDGNFIDSSLNVCNGINITNKQILTGNMVVKAKTLNEATKIAKGCPVLAVGGSVEVRNIIPMES